MRRSRLPRRNFLLGSIASSLGLVSAGRLMPAIPFAWADEAATTGLKDRYYIFAYFGGGWDMLLSLDPRDPTIFTNEMLEDTRIQPAYENLNPGLDQPLIDTVLGPVGHFMGDLATQHADKIAIVRGLNMETLSHDGGRKRFLTGKAPIGTQARGSSASTWLASLLGKGEIVPNLVSRVQAFNADQPPYASGLRVDTIADLLRALKPSATNLDPLVQDRIEELLLQAATCPDTEASTFLQNAEVARLKASEMVSGNVASNFDFQADTPAMVALREHYGLSNANALDSPQARAALAARAIMSGVSRCVSVSVAGGGLDTHSGDGWEREQGPRQMVGFNAIARMVEDLAATPYGDSGESWLDHTSILAFSEFSRTPMINSNGGRDHWLGNSCMVLGPDIKGGTVVGASSDVGMQPQPIDLNSGLVDLNEGVSINPEHVLQTLLVGAGVTGDPADLRVGAIPALLKGA